MTTTTRLPEPSSKHATCAWCSGQFRTVIELIDHVDDNHLADKREIEALPPWTPTADEVAAIVDEMRPLIARLAARDLERLQGLAEVPVTA
jgi:hypothetical protein